MTSSPYTKQREYRNNDMLRVPGNQNRVTKPLSKDPSLARISPNYRDQDSYENQEENGGGSFITGLDLGHSATRN